MVFARMKAKLAVAGLAMAMALGPVKATAETLADAMASAYEHNGLVDQNRALLRVADEDVAQAVSALKPILNWSADITRSWGRAYVSTLAASRGNASWDASVGILAELLLYDFGTSRIKIDIAKESVLATRQALLSAEQSVLLRAAQAYLEILRNQEFVNLRQNNVRVITVELRAARDRFEVGEVTRTDVSIAEARLAGARASLAAAQGGLAAAIEEFRAAVGRKPGRLSRLPRVPQTAKSVEAAKATALANHPEMIKVQHEVTAAELGILAAKGAVNPSIKLTGRYGVSTQLDGPSYSNGGSIGIEASGPIYQGGKLASIARQAVARRDAARAGLHIVRHTLAQNVGNAWAQLQVARASRQASERQVRASTVAFRGVREEATLGARTTLDVLDAEQELLDAKANLISATIDEHTAAYQLLAAMGLLTAERMKLKVPQYDPAAYYNMVKDAPALHSEQGRKLDSVLKALGKE
ncbi:TolC family outer membrane protein [Marimonas arenosa]|uniref:TolC family outer membrane protein n=1 Tax=Marimonas arenosa TaxID=1795305 RepID=A0AAE3WGY9_9RHOB|nr:TolC family outer membrane protein [Marimonas arenosa]MDQ2092333.1 TolC family outer membrane protein [Marimonas arenosa]